MKKTCFFLFFLLLLLLALSYSKERSGVVTISVDLSCHAGKTRLWLPYPVSILEADVRECGCRGQPRLFRRLCRAASGALAYHAEWGEGGSEKKLRMSFEARAEEPEKFRYSVGFEEL